MMKFKINNTRNIYKNGTMLGYIMALLLIALVLIAYTKERLTG